MGVASAAAAVERQPARGAAGALRRPILQPSSA